MAVKMPTPTPQPSPALFFETINAYHSTAALKTALELELFTAISEGAHTASELARRCQASERGVRILCDYLVVLGFLTKDQQRYGLTADSATFLVRTLPAYLGNTTGFLCSPEAMRSYDDLTEVVRQGRQLEESYITHENPLWVEFARSMSGFMRLPAELIAARLGAAQGRKWKVLDVAAGHGIFGVTIARLNPNADIVALDWPAVLEVAQANAANSGVASRYRTLAGSAFEVDFSSGYDVVLLTNFLHHFDVPTCESLLRKVYAALAPNGRVATLEFVPNEDRVSPPIPAKFALIMLAGTPAGDAYTFSELRSMFQNAGFSRSELHTLDPSPHSLVISYR
ncbi:MAG TPA: class I SAM-dependent methyltransferase [Longimicrobiales bacterium]|nr:class I SAM-dependent methyltransferase [Longimicrobiales bacterium]